MGKKSGPGVFISEVVKGGAADVDGRLVQVLAEIPVPFHLKICTWLALRRFLSLFFPPIPTDGFAEFPAPALPGGGSRQHVKLFLLYAAGGWGNFAAGSQLDDPLQQSPPIYMYTCPLHTTSHV